MNNKMTENEIELFAIELLEKLQNTLTVINLNLDHDLIAYAVKQVA